MEGVSNLTINKSFFLATNHSVDQSVNQPVSHSPSRSVSQSAGQSVKKPVSQSVRKSVTQYVNQSVNQSASWPVNHSASQSVCQSGSHSVSQSVSQSVSKSMISVKNCKFPFRLFQGKIGLEVVFDNYLVRKQVALDYKIWILNSGHIGFSQRGQPMILVKKWKFYLCIFLDKWALKYCLMIIEEENKPSQTIKNWILQSCQTEIFYIGVNPRFWSKIANFLFVCLFWQNKSRNNV